MSAPKLSASALLMDGEYIRGVPCPLPLPLPLALPIPLDLGTPFPVSA